LNKKILFIAIILIVLCSFSAVSASEINSTDENGGSDSELLSLPSTSTDTVSMLSNSNVNFTKLNETIANADDSVSLDSDVNLDVNESNFFKDGIIINKTLTIDGNGYTINATCVDGTQARIFNVVNNATLTLKNMDITGAYYSGNGGAIYVDSYSNLILENVIVNENIATTNGGAIYLKSNANLTATDVIFKNNLASNGNTRGGALYAYKNTNVKLVNATFENNTVKGVQGSSTFGTYGGQIFLHSDSNMEIINSSFINTLVMVPFSLNGGVIYLESNSHLTISNSLFENITLKYDRDGSRYYTYSNAGGIINCGGNTVLNITDTVFKDNNNINDGHSYAYGYGLIYSTSSSSQNYITNCIFINNTADRVSAIRTRNADIVSCIFVDNSVNNDYPEIYYEGNGKGSISHNVFLGNGTSIRILNSAVDVVEADNWWGTNNPGQFVRIQDSYQVPNNYVVMSVYNEGNTVYATLTRDSSGDFIENPELLPIRTAIFEASATTTLNTTDAMASTVVDDSEVNVTIDGETVTHVMAQGNITSIEIASVENTSAGANGTIYFVLIGDNGAVDGELTVLVNDKKYAAPVSKGFAIITLGEDYVPGVYDIYYIYEGGDNYAAIPTKTKAEEQFEVYKNDVTITFTRDKNIITFNVAGDNGIVPTGTINVTVGDINNVFSLSNGVASYNYGNDLSPDTYDVNVTYSGSSLTARLALP
jgi:predicted outer membrane repeat protein